MIRMIPTLVAVITMLGLSAPAVARSVFLNGTKIDTVTGQKFNNCDVEIDAHGDVHITAKGYAVKGKERSNEPVPEGQVGEPATRKYYIVTEKDGIGMSQYDLEVFINGKFVRKLLDGDGHIVLDISKYLKVGPNKVRILAHKVIDGERRSASPKHFFRLIMGEGESGGRNVMISRKLLDYRRTAQETQPFNQEFVITAY